MKNQFNSYHANSVMILGVAGGNGLEHIDTRIVNKVYGVDINKDYLDICVKRHLELHGIFDAIPTDLTQKSNVLPYADLVVAN